MKILTYHLLIKEVWLGSWTKIFEKVLQNNRQNSFSYRVVDSWAKLSSAVVNDLLLNSVEFKLDKVCDNHKHFTTSISRYIENTSDDNDEHLTGLQT